ncbi:hypothetical protein APR04_003777 [Promicromonospora umidemergens]|uniref:Uncharacterized protein n=1 Tax=Promicromonospora umidemergens TaxID=629679 RepID=A0ABP8XI98_9MICO|nr:hypothetical protein [Promicromonospora umidemergens]MCP2284854.1 hypothetical protein [Promicromonospora umidemergens]
MDARTLDMARGARQARLAEAADAPPVPVLKLRHVIAQCTACDTWYDIDVGHLCPTGGAAAPTLPSAVVDVAEVPDVDRPHPASLTWVAPLEARPIVLGPSADHPDLRPVLALDGHRFWSGARHGLAVGRARARFDEAAKKYAFAPDLHRAPAEAVELAQAAAAWDAKVADYSRDLAA